MTVGQVIGSNVSELDTAQLLETINEYEKVLVDLGTGDGKFPYRYAKSNPDTLVIGIDASETEMKEISHKASRKPAKGGLENIVYLKMPVEQVPIELTGVADHIYVNFPWGSLLSGTMLASEDVMKGILTLAKPGATFDLFTTYDEKFEPEKMADLSLPELTMSYLQDELAKKYLDYGIEVKQVSELTPEQKQDLNSSWAKKILSQRDRQVFHLSAVINK